MANPMSVLVMSIFTFVACDAANTFLQAEPVRADARSLLISEIEGTFGRGGLREGRFIELENALRPSFASLPTNEYGKLGNAAAHLALHRLFARLYSWNIYGLLPTGDMQNLSSPVSVLKKSLPLYVEELFQQHFDERGFDLNELTVLAVTFDHAFDIYAIEVLEMVYRAHQIKFHGDLTTEDAIPVIETAMIARRLPNVKFLEDATVEGLSFLKNHLKTNDDVLRDNMWRDVFTTAIDEFYSHLYVNRAMRNPFTDVVDFDTVSRIVVKDMQRFWEMTVNQQCSALKDVLTDLEYRDTGRVQLSRYYGHQLAGLVPETFQFDETIDHLKDLGVLYESESRQPLIIIPNYLQMHSNCFKSGNLFEICCKDECEGLMNHLEQAIQSPLADPSVIAKLVANLQSDTVDAPRNLSISLIQRLYAISNLHDGMVPLHGRLFARWMHHAYPRECPYPKAGGAVASVAPDDWIETNARVTSMDQIEMHAFNHSDVIAEFEDVQEIVLPWDNDEQLLDTYPAPQRSIYHFVSLVGRRVFLPSIVFFSALGLAKIYKSASKSFDLHPKAQMV